MISLVPGWPQTSAGWTNKVEDDPVGVDVRFEMNPSQTWTFPTPEHHPVLPNPIKPAAPKVFACKNCNKTYGHQCSLTKHRLYECGKEPSQKCPFCPHATKLRGNLKKHVLKKHLNEAVAFDFE